MIGHPLRVRELLDEISPRPKIVLDGQQRLTSLHKAIGAIADRHPERLVAQCIPMNRQLWQVDRFPDFLIARRELLAAAVNELIANPL